MQLSQLHNHTTVMGDRTWQGNRQFTNLRRFWIRRRIPPSKSCPTAKCGHSAGAMPPKAGFANQLRCGKTLVGNTAPAETFVEPNENPTGYSDRAPALRLRRGTSNQHRRIDGLGCASDFAPALHFGGNLPAVVPEYHARCVRPETCVGTVAAQISRRSALLLASKHLEPWSSRPPFRYSESRKMVS